MRNHLHQEFGTLQRTCWQLHWVCLQWWPEHLCVTLGNLQTEVHIAKSTILPLLGEGFKVASRLGSGKNAWKSLCCCQDNCPQAECTVWIVSISTKQVSTGVTQVSLSQKSRTDEHPAWLSSSRKSHVSGLGNILLVTEGMNAGINPRIRLSLFNGLPS